jgi:hypothetical protein
LCDFDEEIQHEVGYAGKVLVEYFEEYTQFACSEFDEIYGIEPYLIVFVGLLPDEVLHADIVVFTE